MNQLINIERSIIKTYRKEIWRKFIKAVNDYNLIQDNDKIMVCISGGKDSFLLAKCMEELKKHGKINFDVYYVVMDPGYKKEVQKQIIDLANKLNLKIKIFKTDIFQVARKLSKDNPCYLCARMRRGHLYNYAKELGCNKIALGHHFNDVIETTLLSMFYGSEVKTMLPKLYSDNFENIQLIRPLYLVKEDDIIAWKNYNNLDFINCACDFTKKEDAGKRKEVKKIIKYLKTLNSDIDYNIFKAMDNINCILGFRKDKIHKSFLDDYDKKNDKVKNNINTT